MCAKKYESVKVLRVLLRHAWEFLRMGIYDEFLCFGRVELVVVVMEVMVVSSAYFKNDD